MYACQPFKPIKWEHNIVTTFFKSGGHFVMRPTQDATWFEAHWVALDSRGTEHYAQRGKQVVCGSCVFDIICHYGLCRDTKKIHFWQICEILAHSQKCHKTLKWHKNDTKTAQKWHKKCAMPQKRHKKCAMPQKWHKKCAMPQKMCLFCAPDKIHDSKHNGICHGMGIIIKTQNPLTAIRGSSTRILTNTTHDFMTYMHACVCFMNFWMALAFQHSWHIA